MPSPLSPQVLIDRYYEFYNERRFQESAELFAADAVIEHAPFGKVSPAGGKGYVESAERSIHAFPDARIEVLGVHSHGDTIFEIDMVATGTHRGLLDLGTYGRFEPTGIFIRVRHREVLEIRRGLITYASVTLDVNDLLSQLGGARHD